MSSMEFSRWLAYARLEPFGPLREDYRAGQVLALLANINRDRKVQPQAYGPDDFFATLAPEPPDPEELMAMQIEQFKAIGAAYAAMNPAPETA